MAKKIEKAEMPVVETVVETTKPKRKEPTKNIVGGWEIKDRVYKLTENKSPLTFTIKSRGQYYFDKEAGYEREIKYCKNQKTVFVDEMQGDQILGSIVFRNGVLAVPANEVILQKYLSLYSPSKDVHYFEIKPQERAINELEEIELEVDALVAARTLDIDMTEAIMRVELGSSVAKMSSKELKRDLLVFAKRNPKLFLDLMNDDNIHLRNIGIKATELGILSLSPDNRVFSWASNNRKLMNVPFDEHPYSALAAWFKTDEGMEVLTSIEKQLK
tara:strand:+ start:1352 stop:2170 length:819 start_codon:yes stop_codon:yes gene_type:complete